MDIGYLWETSVVLQLFGGLSHKPLEASRQNHYTYFPRIVMITDSSIEGLKTMIHSALAWTYGTVFLMPSLA
jgi:hypothetical protein